jgi:hypothetical protein
MKVETDIITSFTLNLIAVILVIHVCLDIQH